MKIKNIILIFIFSFFASNAHAFTDGQAERALLGEARGQSYREVLAHGCALKNRGTLQGVYGYKNPIKERLTKETIDKIKKAWYNAKNGPDIVSGRTEWRSDYDLKLMRKRGETVDSHGLTDPIKIGATTFYRLKNGRR